jgi:hypothetical protein
MARAGEARTPIPGQMSLDDWAEMLSASPDASASPRGGARSVDAPERVAPAETSNGSGRGASADAAAEHAAPHRAVATALLEMPGALLTRTHLRELGLERRAIDAVFRKLPVVTLPGYSRPMIHVEQYLELIDEHTYRDDRVRPRNA